ncbi:hypothetical protein RCH14_000741 [Massilia sp. MP_M2]
MAFCYINNSMLALASAKWGPHAPASRAPARAQHVRARWHKAQQRSAMAA